MIKYATITLTLTLAGVLSGCGYSSSVPYSFDSGKPLVVGYELSPLTFSTFGDTVEGLSYDILKAISTEHGVNLGLKAYSDIANAEEDLRTGNIDLLISNMPLTVHNKEKFLFTEPVYTDRLVLVQNKNDSNMIQSPHELADSEVYVIDNKQLVNRLENLSEEIGGTIRIVVLPGDTEETIIMKVATGEIPRGAVGKAIACLFSGNLENIDYSTELSFNQFRGWQMMPEDSVLCDSLNKWIMDFQKTRQYDAIIKKYLKIR